MTATALPQTHVLLLVEDNPADADLVEELLDQAGVEQYAILRAARLSEALEKIRAHTIDVVLLDLRLPDGVGLATLQAIRSVNQQIPIVVLTGNDDEALAMSCIKAGAQDYLCKGELRPAPLRRSIGYAISRLRESQLREIEEALSRYRSLSSHTSRTLVTATLAGTGAVRERYPGAFSEIVEDYQRLLTAYCIDLAKKNDKPREAMDRVVNVLGDSGAGPRDLMDVHLMALNQLVSGMPDKRSSALLIEARLLALEMMGLLVDYYRVGQFRQRPRRITS